MKKVLLGGACAASLLLALTPVVQAADMPVAEPMGMGWYVSVFGGWSHAKDESFSLETTAATPATLDVDLDLDDGFMVGAALGAQFNEWLRAEVEVSGHFHDVEGDGTLTPGGASPVLSYYDVEGDEDALFALANLWVELPLGGVFRPYIGGGIGFGRLSLDLSINNTTATTHYTLIDDDDWGFAYQLGGGLAFDIAPNWAIDVGYRYKVINNVDFDIDDDAADNLLGVTFDEGVDKDYKSHNILVGLRFGF